MRTQEKNERNKHDDAFYGGFILSGGERQEAGMFEWNARSPFDLAPSWERMISSSAHSAAPLEEVYVV